MLTRCNTEKRRYVPAVTLAVAGGLLTFLSPVGNALALSNDDRVQPSNTRSLSEALFGKRYYVGVGAGRSWLEPGTSEVDSVDPDMQSDTGIQLSIGMDYSPLMSFELSAASLGEAGLSSSTIIEYNHIGVSSLIYVGGARQRFNRRGFSGFARIGLGSIISDADEGVLYEKESDVQITLGLGAEYAMSSGLAVRAEAMTFDVDANYMQLGLVYRFGPQPQMSRQYVAPRVILRDQILQAAIPDKTTRPIPVPTTPTPRASLALKPVASSTAVSLDLDNDGIKNRSDACNNSLPGIAVDELGCAIIQGVLEGVTFKTGSSELTSYSMSSLDDTARILLRAPTMKIELSAYTDNVGLEAQNDALSAQRVKAVATYLVGKGISQSRFTLKAFGERRPIASNYTEEGRQANRRIEIKGIR